MAKQTALAVPDEGPLKRLLEALERFLSEIPETADQREDGLDTLPTRAAEADRSTLIADIPFPALETSQPSGARAGVT